MKKPNKIQVEEGVRLSRKHVRKALAGITDIRAFIHRLRLSVNDTGLQNIESAIGVIKARLEINNKNHYMPQYNLSSYHKVNNYNVTLYSSRKSPVTPKFMLMMTNHDQAFLGGLLKDIPNLKVSSAEYTIDLFCKSPEHASMLFYVLRRYMYFPGRAFTSMSGGKFDGVDVTREMNAVYNVWKRAKGKKDIVIYERGKDADRIKGVWPYETIDRVRVEFLVKSTRLRELGMVMLKDFIVDNAFSQAISKKINFCEFCKNKNIPMFHQDYNSKDASGNIESFQEEYFQASKKVDNINQYVNDFKLLEGLKNKMFSAVDSFELEWKDAGSKLSV